MSSYKTNLWRLLAGKFLLLMLAMATACSESDEPGLTTVPEKDPEAKVYMSITIPYDISGNMSRSGGNRPTDDKHQMEPEYSWDDMYENEINLEDIAMYIFQVYSDGTSKLRFYSYSSKDYNDKLGFGSMSVQGNFGRYVMVNLDVQDWPIDQSENINLKIIMMCNKSGLGGTNTGVNSYPIVTEKNKETFSINHILNESVARGNTFSINAEWRPRPEGNNDYIPEKDPNESTEKMYYRHIPMFGYLDVTVPGAELLKSQPYDRVDLSVMWALRAVAKIEIIDGIERYTGSEYPKIQKVTIEGRITRGCLIPWEYTSTNTNTYINGKQVETISLPMDISYLKEKYILNDFKDKTIWDYVTTGTGSILEKKTVKQLFRVYTPEMPADRLASIKLTVTVEDGDGTSKDYTMSLKEYTNGTTSQLLFNTDIVRNHIYRIRVAKALESRAGENEFTPVFEITASN